MSFSICYFPISTDYFAFIWKILIIKFVHVIEFPCWEEARNLIIKETKIYIVCCTNLEKEQIVWAEMFWGTWGWIRLKKLGKTGRRKWVILSVDQSSVFQTQAMQWLFLKGKIIIVACHCWLIFFWNVILLKYAKAHFCLWLVCNCQTQNCSTHPTQTRWHKQW